jgi:hypothetical protein
MTRIFGSTEYFVNNSLLVIIRLNINSRQKCFIALLPLLNARSKVHYAVGQIVPGTNTTKIIGFYVSVFFHLI